MFWIISALIAAFARTAAHILNKRILKNVDSIQLVFATSIFISILYLPIFLSHYFTNPIITSNGLAYLTTFASGTFNVIGLLLLMKALSDGEISVAVPLRNLVPLFGMVLAIIFLGEKITLILFIATILVVFGTILLHLQKDFHLHMIRKPSLYALLAAVSYSFALIVDKYSTNYINPAKYTYLVHLVMLVIMFFVILFRKEFFQTFGFIKKRYKEIFLITLFVMTGSFFTFTAISLVNVTIVAPILRLEVLLSVIVGGWFFKEENLIIKVLGAFLIFAGVLMIIL